MRSDVHDLCFRSSVGLALCGNARDKQFQGSRHNRKFDGQTSQRLTIDLSIDGIGVQWFADQRFGFPKVHAFLFTKLSHPESRQIAEITETTLCGERHDLETVFEQICLVGNLERAAVISCPADDDESGFQLMVASSDAEARESVAKNFARALPPVGQDADAGFQSEINRIDNHAVRTGTGHGEKIALAIGLLKGSRQTESDFANLGVDEAARGARDVPREIEFLSENIGGASGKKRQRNAVAIGIIGQAIDDFVERAIAAAGDDELTPVTHGLLSYFRSVSRAGGFGKIGLDTVGGENLARLVDQPPPPIAAIAGVGVVDQNGVLDKSIHEFQIAVSQTFILTEKPETTERREGKTTKKQMNSTIRYFLLFPEAGAT
jgi:hypothetical protein